MLSMNFLKVVLVIASVDFIFVVQSIVGKSSCTQPNTAMVNPLISQIIDKKFNIFAQTLQFGTVVSCQVIKINGTDNPPTSGYVTISGAGQPSQYYPWNSYSNGSLTYQIDDPSGDPNNDYNFLIYNDETSSQSCAVKICPDGGSANILIMSTASSLSTEALAALEQQTKGTDANLATVNFTAVAQSNCGST